MYFLEGKINLNCPPPIMHAEYCQWQCLKNSYVGANVWMYALERVSGLILTLSFIDLLLGLLFFVAYITAKGFTSQTKNQEFLCKSMLAIFPLRLPTLTCVR